MASGFIVLKDGRCFGRRWTGYDETDSDNLQTL